MSDSSFTENAPIGEGFVFCATPSTRMPPVLSSSALASTTRFISAVSGATVPSYSTKDEIWSISSMAPLVMSCVLPAVSATTTLMRRRSKSNGISSTLR